MVSTKTARQRLRNYTRYLDFTLDKYREALEYVNRVVYAEWSDIETLRGKYRLNFIEHMIHSTTGNTAKYAEFDQRYYKFPSYLRRAVVSDAIGNVASHMTRFREWKSDPKGKAPQFQPLCTGFPVFYKGVMSEWLSNGKVALKLYSGSDWIWFILPFDPISANRFPVSEGWERQNPMLVKESKRWRLHFPFQKTSKFPDKDFKQPILSVDLGINCTATVSVVSSDGTVLHRDFINYGREKDHLKTIIGSIAVKSAQTWYIPEGSSFCRQLWDEVRHLTDEIAHQCSSQLVKLAKEHNCQAIVFEHLGKLKVQRCTYGAARRRRKFHYWLQGRIQNFTKYKAQAEGIRFSRVLARGTSEQAFDGSGKVRRFGNRQIALFRNEKFYNSDLSACYNIGARYWIREIQDLLIKLPKKPGRNDQVATQDKSSYAVAARHEQTLASLISLVRFVSHVDATESTPYSGQGCSLNRETATIAAA